MSTALTHILESQRQQFAAVLSVPSINFDREAGFALQHLAANEFLGRIASQNPDSLKAAICNVAAIGITLNPASKLAYLVPRKVGGQMKVCLDLSYMGLLAIAQDCGAIRWGQAIIVRKADAFTMNGIDVLPTHQYNPFGTDEDRGPIEGAYVVVKTPEGDYLTHAMSIARINEIRDRSEAWKAYQQDNKKTCPWVTDYPEMCKKTVIKQAHKTWPRKTREAERLAQAIHYLNTDGGEGLAMVASTTTKDVTPATEAQIQEVMATCKAMGRTGEDLKRLLKHLFGREFDSPADLTADEAKKTLAAMNHKQQKEAA